LTTPVQSGETASQDNTGGEDGAESSEQKNDYFTDSNNNTQVDQSTVPKKHRNKGAGGDYYKKGEGLKNPWARLRNKRINRVGPSGPMGPPVGGYGDTTGTSEQYTPEGNNPKYTNETGFLTPDAAGKAALDYINPTSIKNNKEYAGWIYSKKNADGDTRYHYTEPVVGSDRNSDATKSKVPGGVNVVGHYHTHGAYSKIDPNNPNGPLIPATPKEDPFSDNFSWGGNNAQGAMHGLAGYYSDKNYNYGFKFYLGTPSGEYKMQTYQVGTRTASPSAFIKLTKPLE